MSGLRYDLCSCDHVRARLVSAFIYDAPFVEGKSENV